MLIQAITASLMGHGNKEEGGGNFFCFIFVCNIRGRVYMQQKMVGWVDSEVERGEGI